MSNWIETKDRLPTESDSSGNYVLAWNPEVKCWQSHRWTTVKSPQFPAWKPLAPYQPPATVYRPFTRDEFLPHKDRWLKNKHGDYFQATSIYRNGVAAGEFESWDTLFQNYTFADDGTPCGVPE